MVGCANEQSTTNHLPLVNTVQKTDSSTEDSIVDVSYEDLSIKEKKEVDNFWKLFCNALLNNDTSVIIANTKFPFIGSVYDTLDDRAVDIDDPQLLKKYYGYVYPEWAIDSLHSNGYKLSTVRSSLDNQLSFEVVIYFNDVLVDTTNFDEPVNIEYAVMWYFKQINGRYFFVKFVPVG